MGLHKMTVCDPSSVFFGFMGITSAVVFANLGAAYGTAKSGVGISSMGVMRPDMIMRSIIPVVMAGVLGIYGLITAVIINGKMMDNPGAYSAFLGYAHLGAGLTVGMSSLAAGPPLRWYDPDPHFRRGAGFVRSHCRARRRFWRRLQELGLVHGLHSCIT